MLLSVIIFFIKAINQFFLNIYKFLYIKFAYWELNASEVVYEPGK